MGRTEQTRTAQCPQTSKWPRVHRWHCLHFWDTVSARSDKKNRHIPSDFVADCKDDDGEREKLCGHGSRMPPARWRRRELSLWRMT